MFLLMSMKTSEQYRNKRVIVLRNHERFKFYKIIDQIKNKINFIIFLYEDNTTK